MKKHIMLQMQGGHSSCVWVPKGTPHTGTTCLLWWPTLPQVPSSHQAAGQQWDSSLPRALACSTQDRLVQIKPNSAYVPLP